MATTWRGQDGQVAIGGTPETIIGGVYRMDCRYQISLVWNVLL